MQTKLFLLLMLSTLAITAQNHFPLIDTSASWATYHNGPPFPRFVLYSVSGDTLVGGQSWAKVYETTDSVMDISSPKARLYCGMREANHYVIRAVFQSPGITRIDTLYNFNAQVNDTVGYTTSGHPGDSSVVTIEAIDSVLIDGTYRTRWVLGVGPTIVPSVWIDGIGSTAGLFCPFAYMVDFAFGSSHLLCYSYNGVVLYMDTVYNRCFVNVGMEPHMQSNSPLKIYPNPAHTHFKIQTGMPLQNQIITVFDLQGRLVMEHKLPDPGQSVDVSELPKGCYLIRVQTGRGRHTFAGLLIKE